jgi:hypothetical protein
MRIRLIFRVGWHTEPQQEMFCALSAPPRRWLPMFGSVATHLAVLSVLPLVADQWRQYKADDFDWSTYRVEYRSVRVPDVLYYEPQRPAAKKKVTAKAARPLKPASNGAAASLTPGGRHQVVVPIGLELPPLEAAISKTAIVLQPDSQPQPKAPDPGLPSVAFWARSSRPLKPFEVPSSAGSTEQPGPPPKLAEPPVLAVPNRETLPGQLNVAAAPPVPSPLLPLPSAATAPLRDQKSGPETGVFDRSPGQASNLIALSTRTATPGEVVRVRPGSHGATVSDSAPGGSAGAVESTAKGSAEQRNGSPPAPEAASAASAQHSVSGKGASPETDVTRRLEPASSGRTPNAPAASGRDAAQPAEPRGAQAVTRIMHPPNGNFDVVVTQSGSRDQLAGVPNGLAGSPVYTVFLSVGDEKEWVLAFCLPPTKSARNNSYQVFVEDPAPLAAPYPISTAIPSSIVGESRSAPLAFHALLTAGGRLDDLQARTPGDMAAEIAPLLKQWQFRPARRNDLPVDIEVLLILPAVSGRPGARLASRLPAAAQ